ncbi:MAG: hypothetical protein LBC77_05890 [Spirochaetaceae bacterium]|jgi:tetratricopeptide (TPR) repeat protein|nr:hypothetical protein [Spirochaetaceae bacterium]
MIQIVFSIKFQSQLRRTRPALYEALEKTIITSAEASGGKTRQAFHCIIADFNESAMGFWIDILSCIETINKAIHAVSRDLYGYICVISALQDDETIPSIMRTLPSDGKASGIWCSSPVRGALNYFADFGPAGHRGRDISIKAGSESYTEIEAIKQIKLKETGAALYEKVPAILGEAGVKRAVLLGGEYTGKRECLRRYCAETSRAIPPLIISYGSGGAGLSCLANAYSPEIRGLFTEQKISTGQEMDMLFESLERERLRKESSKYTLFKARRFFSRLLNAYCEAAEKLKLSPIVILEEVQRSCHYTRQIVLDALEAKDRQKSILIYGTCSGEPLPERFSRVFHNVIELSAETPAGRPLDSISPSLLETAYACKLFYKYFPRHIFPELFEELGKNKRAIRRTLELLHQHKIIRSIDDPEPVIKDLAVIAENTLGGRCAYIRSLVKNALLSRLSAGTIAASYNLLEALHELGGGITDELALDAVRADIINGTCTAIEEALANGSFGDVTGNERAGALYYCYKTLSCLLFSKEDEIRETFRTLKNEDSSIAIYKSQMLTIAASYKMGVHDTNAALGAIKESMVISQRSGRRTKNAQVYRLFSLVNLSKKELSDALDYLSFAIDDAEKNKDHEELTVSTYYAANAHFIFGNLSKAERLIKQAEQTARLSGRQEWALRSQFVLGRFYFEMGKYRNALSIFKSLVENNDEETAAAMRTVVQAWIFRTELYLYECMPEKTDGHCSDSRLFEIEACYLTGNYEAAAKLASEFLDDLPQEHFLFLEQPDWQSGFSQCELLEFTQTEFWTRMCTVWRSLAICRLEEGGNEEAIRAMSKIMRDERFSDYDPNAPFYFFANFRVLTESSSAEVDRNTAISMAFKRLQRRAGRIDDIETRRAFLANQYWNKILFNTAKDYKLI